MRKLVPLRNFIYDRLYNPAGGYFCRKDFQVGQLSSPIDFKSLIGFDDYQQQLYKRYPKNAWLTPSQIFKPYYGMSIANYILQAQQKYRLTKNPSLAHRWTPPKLNNKIRIVQAGAGTGSAAQSILFYFKNNEQQLFQNIQYTIVQISPVLCQYMERKLKKVFPQMFQRGQIKIVNKDIQKYGCKENVYVVFLEVFDNLPHDKVRQVGGHDGVRQVGKDGSGQIYEYSVVDLQTNQEKYENIDKDKLVKQCLQLYTNYQKQSQSQPKKKQPFLTQLSTKILQKFYTPSPSSSPSTSNQLFLPTNCLQLLKSLNQNIPNCHLIASDFDSLITNIPGKYAPIVSYKGQGSADKKDYGTYLVQRGAADIFFPVDFEFVRYMVKEVMGQGTHVVKSYEFFEEFGVDDWANSRSGFNPLKEDFGNTSFILTKI